MRAAPRRHPSAWTWARRHLFDGVPSSAATLALLAGLIWAAPLLWQWAVAHAVWAADADACQAARGTGACWGVVTEKHRLILLGRYPFEAQWRPIAATVLMAAMLVLSCIRRAWRAWLLPAWGAVLLAFFVLMGGGLGLAPVPTELWGGLPLTLMLSTLAIVLAFPLAVALALGRRSQLPLIRALCGLYVELIRGVPLISVLFMASFMFPLLLPSGTSPDVLLRVLVGITLFAAAYLAEIVRGGLQSLPAGQQEAAAAIGLTWWQAQRRVLLPQALAAVVPALMNSFISIFKDTSLITIVSLYELTGSLGLALNGDPLWRPYLIEGYLFITAIYFAVCFAMSRYSLWIEAQLHRSHAR